MADASIVTSCPVVGGDLAQGNEIAVAVTVLGECPGRGAVYRSGARPGDELLVTGPPLAARPPVFDVGERARRSRMNSWSRTVDRGPDSPKEWRLVGRPCTR